MSNEDVILEEALDNLREAAQKIRAVSNRMRATDMREGDNRHNLAHRVASLASLATSSTRKDRGYGGGP
ncbi:MAG: hypothetical protein M3R38_32280 [Actinomycetota bacterium]|nr:hypothetical protein [Actinomycetota bacterium]